MATNEAKGVKNAKGGIWKRGGGAAQALTAVQDGPGTQVKWHVPDGTRDPTTGELAPGVMGLVHDDLLISAALCYALDGQVWGLAESDVI